MSAYTLIRGVVGALLGAVVGYFSFVWLVRQGFYGLILPAALPGIFAGLVARQKAWAVAAVAVCVGIVAALFSEWRIAPFLSDSSAGYFIRHIGDLRPVIKLLVLGGALLGGGMALAFGYRPSKKVQ